MATKAKHILISGRVQGVGFRNFTAIEAATHDLKGWVRNLSDGSVEILASGEEAPMEEFIAHIKKGPLMAKVVKAKVVDVEVEWSDRTNGFHIAEDADERDHWRPEKR